MYPFKNKVNAEYNIIGKASIQKTIKVLTIAVMFMLLSFNAYSGFEDLKMNVYYTDGTFVKNDVDLRYDANTYVRVRFEDGLPIYGNIFKGNELKEKIEYMSSNETQKKNNDATFFHPQVDYEKKLIRAYSFPYNSFTIKFIDAMTGKIVLDANGGSDKKIDGSLIIGEEEDSGTIFNYSDLNKGFYFVILYNEKDEIYFISTIEN